MTTLVRRALVPLSALKHRPWPLSTAVAPQVDINEPLEEECTPYYSPERFHAPRLGGVLNNRYQLATKLGCGSSSTTWLARDLNQWRWQKEKYVALKLCASLKDPSNPVQRELDTHKRLSEGNPRHKGHSFVRHLLDSFELKFESKKCQVLIFEPLREPLWIYRRRFIHDTIPSAILKIMVEMTLHGLDYLHSECRVIHTDLKPANIMVKVEDLSILEDAAKDEFKHPIPQKTYPDGRTIYLSRNNFGPPRRITGIIQITDFDLAVMGDKPNDGCIQGDVYRAPEVMLDAGYSYSADIWNLGVMLWDLLEGKFLFNNCVPGQDGEYRELDHFASINALLGPPPKEMLDKGKRTSRFYNGGIFKGPTVDPAKFNFESLLTKVQREDKKMFIEFVQRMLKWRPEERSTAKELLQDPWLKADFDYD